MYNIILIIILQSFISVVFSQEIKDGFKIVEKENLTMFQDVNSDKYSGPILYKNGERAYDPTSEFSSKEKLKKIERELYSVEERQRMLMDYSPIAVFTIRAYEGEIVAVSFGFRYLADPSVIDTEKLQIMRKKMMAELSYKNLLFNGQKAVSGYMLGYAYLFKD